MRPGVNPQDEPSSFPWLDPQETDSQKVLERLLAEAAEQIPGLSPDPSLTDPLVRLLLSAVAKEYSHIYSKLDEVIDTASRQLVDNMLTFPRAPQPSSTVLQLGVSDGGTRVDENLVIVGRKSMPDGDSFKERNIHFVPYDEEEIPGLPPAIILRQTTDGQVSLCTTEAPVPAGNVDPGPANWLHIGLDLSSAADMEEIPLFLQAANDDLVAGLIWSTWSLGDDKNSPSFIPGSRQANSNWNGRGNPPLMRSRSDIQRPPSPFDQRFVTLSMDRLRQHGRPKLDAAASASAAGVLDPSLRLHWLSIRCAEHLDPGALAGVRFLPNCLVAFNLQTDVAQYKIGRTMSEVVDLPVAYEELFRVSEVRDAENVIEYVDAETSDSLQAEAVYHLDRHPDGHVRLRLMTRSDPQRPRSIEVMYTVTSGFEANGLALGSVDTVYNRRLAPGVTSAVNISVSAGGQAAIKKPWLSSELRAQLATRGRAVTEHDFEVLTRAYDPDRISGVRVGRGVMRGPQGFTSCVQVKVRCLDGTFHGGRERTQFRQGLQEYLMARSPADLQVLVELESS